MKASAILGLNARTQLFSYSHNKSHGKGVAASKLWTYRVLSKVGMPTPEICAKFINPGDILNYDWSRLPSAFALKPSRGLGGEGIIVVKRRAKDGNGWMTTSRERVTAEDLKLHALDILDGAYSLNNEPDIALVQEYVGRHKAFKKYAYRGTPDIRVIVFNKVPVMAMLRLPTKDSGGRANLHQGALGVGIDIATGITTYAIWYGDYVKYKPGTKRKLHGIKIPNWTKILETAVKAHEVAKLGYAGVDIVIHPSRGPMILELNYQPGLQIQLANKEGLRKRLERVEDLKVRDPEHGVHIAKALFAASFAHRVRPKDEIKTISALEEITIKGVAKGQRKKVMAKIDTGAYRTSVEYKIAKELGLLRKENIFLTTRRVRSSLGVTERPIIGFTFWLAGRKIKTYTSVAKRDRLRYSVIIGRRDLSGFLVDPLIESHTEEAEKRVIEAVNKKDGK